MRWRICVPCECSNYMDVTDYYSNYVYAPPDGGRNPKPPTTKNWHGISWKLHVG